MSENESGISFKGDNLFIIREMRRAIYMTNLLRSLISLDRYNFSEPLL